MKGKHIEGLVAVGLFLVGWIFAQVVSLPQSVLKSIESLAVIAASISAIGAAFIAVKALYTWKKSTLYEELKEISFLIEEEIRSLIEIELDGKKLMFKLTSDDPSEVYGVVSNLLQLIRMFIVSRIFLLMKCQQVIPRDCEDGNALNSQLKFSMDILEELQSEISKLNVEDVEIVGKIGSLLNKVHSVYSHHFNCSEIIRNRLNKI
ncbi:hypothetical protein [Shewanella sp. Iso12]|uniref:hypothetical protein n=1 Tax=Shewanella TaxID=22 RepID=UPI001430AD59|nr:hypothetical protein [Shewanella sp. Iso12]NJI82852.1 hypothetical protein [Shewanella sp. Iso12]